MRAPGECHDCSFDTYLSDDVPFASFISIKHGLWAKALVLSGFDSKVVHKI